MNGRISRLSENAPIQTLLTAEKYLEERKVNYQRVGTVNVKSEINGPVSATVPLSFQSPQSPNTGMEFLEYRVTQKVMDDLFCDIIFELHVNGQWYRPSDALRDQQNGLVPYRAVISPEIINNNTRNSRLYNIVLYGPYNAEVTIKLWAVILGGVQ